jgi:predicted nucleic acid-binding protein
MPTSTRRRPPGPAADVFVDTRGWIALLSRDDAHHASAVAAWPGVLRRFRRVVATNLVIAEAYTFLRRAVGVQVAWTMLERLRLTPRLALIYADADLERNAQALLRQYRDHDVSYTDAVSFAAMRRAGLAQAFGFDRHFLTARFALLPQPTAPP